MSWSFFLATGEREPVLTLGAFSLAYAEMSLVMAALFCPRGPCMKLYETDRSDADPACCFLLPLPRHDTKGIRVTVEA